MKQNDSLFFITLENLPYAHLHAELQGIERIYKITDNLLSRDFH